MSAGCVMEERSACRPPFLVAAFLPRRKQCPSSFDTGSYPAFRAIPSTSPAT